MSTRNLTNKQLLAAMQHSTGFLWTVPDAPTQIITVQTDRVGSGRWGVFRHGVDDRSVWTGQEWVTALDASVQGRDLYGWELQDAIRQVQPQLDALTAEHRAWQERHAAETLQAAELGEQIDEWLDPIVEAEASSEVAAA